MSERPLSEGEIWDAPVGQEQLTQIGPNFLEFFVFFRFLVRPPGTTASAKSNMCVCGVASTIAAIRIVDHA